MNELSLPKRRIVQNLMDTGFAHAAHSLAVMINQDITYEMMSFGESPAHITDAQCFQRGITTLLITDILGELGGKSFLMLTDREGEILQDSCLLDAQDADYRTTMGEAILEEIDNVVSAAMITKLSEALDLRIFGGVPQMLRMPVKRIEEAIVNDYAKTDDESYFFVHARFLSKKNLRFQPQFVWKFQPSFLSSLVNYADVIRSDTTS